MAAKSFNVAYYADLLGQAHPRIPRTDEDNEALITALAKLQSKETVSPEEEELIRLYLLLIENFEESHYSPKKKAKPHAILRELMRARDMKPKDIYGIFGSKGTTSEVLRGKRAISKSAAKALAKLFGVSAELFI